jgi:hypothetical protein
VKLKRKQLEAAIRDLVAWGELWNVTPFHNQLTGKLDHVECVECGAEGPKRTEITHKLECRLSLARYALEPLAIPTLSPAVQTGRAGGLARAAKLTPEERRATAQKAAAARWGNKEPCDHVFESVPDTPGDIQGPHHGQCTKCGYEP